MAIDRNNEGEANCGLGRGDADGKDRDHYSNRWLLLRTEAPESDEVEVRGREHQLDSDQNEYGVTPAERGEQADREQRARDDKKELKSGSHGEAVTRVKTLQELQ